MTSTERYTSVWDALEETPGAAENMRIRSALMQELVAYINRSGMTQAQVARKFGHPAPHLRSHPGQDRPLQHRRPGQHADRSRVAPRFAHTRSELTPEEVAGPSGGVGRRHRPIIMSSCVTGTTLDSRPSMRSAALDTGRTLWR